MAVTTELQIKCVKENKVEPVSVDRSAYLGIGTCTLSGVAVTTKLQIKCVKEIKLNLCQWIGQHI